MFGMAQMLFITTLEVYIIIMTNMSPSRTKDQKCD